MRLVSRFAPLVCLVFGACTAMQGGARLAPMPTPPPAPGIVFPGIINSTGAQPTRRFVFNIHGMGCTTRDYNNGLIESLEAYRFTDVGSPMPSPSAERTVDGDCNGELDPPTLIAEGWHDVPLAHAVDVRGEGLDCRGGAAAASPCRYATFGSLRVDHLHRTEPGRTEDLFIYTYFWNDDFWALQRAYLAADLAGEGRALLNGGLKGEVMDRGFSDAVAYLGPIGTLARESVRSAICAMLWHASAVDNAATRQVAALQGESNCLNHAPTQFSPNTEFAFISHSLGSRMLLDALSVEPAAPGPTLRDGPPDRSEHERSAVRALAENTRVVYMAANQIPLLGIGRVRFDTPRTQSREDICDTRSFLYCRSTQSSLSDTPLHVIGFYDPDDLLGFRADGAIMETANEEASEGVFGLRFLNVRHRNASQWLWTLTWPPSAHDQELNRESSRRLIFCGAIVDSDGRLTPNMHRCGRR